MEQELSKAQKQVLQTVADGGSPTGRQGRTVKFLLDGGFIKAAMRSPVSKMIHHYALTEKGRAAL